MLMMMETGPEIIDIRLAPEGKGEWRKRRMEEGEKRGEGGGIAALDEGFFTFRGGREKCACKKAFLFRKKCRNPLGLSSKKNEINHEVKQVELHISGGVPTYPM